jgi:hypothetical protein
MVKRVHSNRESAVIVGDVMVFIHLREYHETVASEAAGPELNCSEQMVRVGRVAELGLVGGQVREDSFLGLPGRCLRQVEDARPLPRSREVLTRSDEVFMSSRSNPGVNRRGVALNRKEAHP